MELKIERLEDVEIIIIANIANKLATTECKSIEQHPYARSSLKCIPAMLWLALSTGSQIFN